MTTETDDLSYYETELPTIIAGVRRGEKWEYNPGTGWFEPANHALDNLALFLTRYNYRVRLAPVPVVRLWSEPADVPGPICWIRMRDRTDEDTTAKNLEGLIVAISDIGFSIQTGSVQTVGWSQIEKLSKCEHSTDRIHWSPCVKPEGGK